MTKPPAPDLRLAVRQRVIYADTDQMGFVYHGTYPRFLEAARVEFMRGLGHTYARVEAKGLGMPLTDLAISYLAPARYDDLLSVHVGIAELSFARLRTSARTRPTSRSSPSPSRNSCLARSSAVSFRTTIARSSA